MARTRQIKLDSKGAKKFQAYTLYISTNKTQAEIAKDLGVDRTTIINWLKEVRAVIDEKAIMEEATKDLVALVPNAVRNIGRAVEKDTMTGYLASKDILKNKDLLRDKVQVQHEFPDDDEELLNELTKSLNGRFKPAHANGQKTG